MSDWKLKILSGEYLGSELDLAAGSYICGSDDNADLVFQDHALLPSHFRLDLRSDGARLIRLNADSQRLDMDDDEQEGEEIEQGALIDVDGFLFSLANQPITWPQTDESKAKKTDTLFAAPISDIVSEIEEENARGKSKRKGWTETFRDLKVKLGVIGASTGLLMLLAAGAMTSKGPEDDNNYKTPIEMASDFEFEVKHALDLHDVEILPMLDGQTWSVEGYIDSAADFQRLKRWAETSGHEMTLKVRVIDELVEGAEIALTALGYSNVDVLKGNKAGYLIFTGKVEDEAVWKKNLGRLQVDVPGILGFDDQVIANTRISAAPFPNLIVKGIYMGKVPFFVLKNGEKYFVGSQLEYGYLVEDIAPDMLQLRRGEKLIQYRLGAD